VLKRLTWAGLGLVTGLGASTWLEYQARKRLRRYLRRHPGSRYAVAAGEAALGKLEGARLALAAATAEGRRAMQEREQELRARLAGQASPGSLTGPGFTGQPHRAGLRRAASPGRPPRAGLPGRASAGASPEPLAEQDGAGSRQ
jgi:hypothetical protein